MIYRFQYFLENSALLNVGPVVLQNSSKKCSFCNHYGASLACNKDECNKIYHFPCATASGAFQEISSSATLCSDHFGQVALLNNGKLIDIFRTWHEHTLFKYFTDMFIDEETGSAIKYVKLGSIKLFSRKSTSTVHFL